MSKTLKNRPIFDFEVNARKVIRGTNGERRWRSRSKGGLLDRTRRLTAVAMEKYIQIVTKTKCFIDSWRSTPESVTEHHHKQFYLMTRMLLIESQKGNAELFRRLDSKRLLIWANLHDLAEGHEDFYDVHYHDKRSSPEIQQKFDQMEAKVMAEIMASIFSAEYQAEYSAWPIGRIDQTKCKANQANEYFWKAAEEISHVLFMLEEISVGKISKVRRERFSNDVMHHIKWLKEHAWQFASVREIVEHELIPKWIHVQGNV